MPMYEHYCQECDQVTEHFCRIDDRKQFVICPCGGSAERVITASIQRVEPTWLDDAKMGLHSQDRHKLTDRNSFNAYLKREGIAQIG